MTRVIGVGACIVLVAAVVLGGCSGGSGGADAAAGADAGGAVADAGTQGSDAGADAGADAGGDAGADGGTPGLALDEPLGDGQVRAGVITKASELLGGTGARGAVGDLKLYNSRVAFVVQAVENPKSWGPYGGSLIDAALLAPGETRGNDLFYELVQAFGMPPRALKPSSVEVTADGSDGKAAVVRVKGKDGGIHILDAALCPGSLCEDMRLVVTTDYSLEPGADRIKVETRIVSKSRTLDGFALGDMFHAGDRTRTFAPGAGYDVKTGTHTAWIGGLSPEVSYGYLRGSADRTLSIPLIQDEIILVQGAEADLPRGQEYVYTRYLAVAAGSAEALWAIERDLRGDTNAGTVAGTVENGESAQVTAALATAGGAVSQAWVGADGAFSLTLAPGRYRLLAQKKGVHDAAPVEVDVASGAKATAALSLEAPAILRVDVSAVDAAGLPIDPVPSRVALIAGLDAPPTGGHAGLLYVRAGVQEFTFPPGEYTAYVTRGLEFEYAKANVTLVAGQTTDLAAVLTHSVPTPGMVTADLHLHTSRSIDAQRVEEEHVAALAGEGVEVLASTDHDYIDDVQGVIDAEGYTPWARALTGTEVSPVWGHMNAYPIPPGPAVGRYFTIPFIEHDDDGNFVRKIWFPEVFTLARAAGAKVLQMNHPRNGAAYFTHAGYDPAVGVASADPEKWSAAFDAFEVWNAGEDDQFLRTKMFPDWWSFLNQGLNFTAVGNSDAHNAGGGHPRNLVAVGVDRADEVSPDAFAGGILAHRSIVQAGPVITLSAGTAGIGDTITGATADLRVKVEAPLWVPVNFVEVVRNGEIEQTFELDEGLRQGTVAFDDVVPLAPDRDSWYVVLAGHRTADLSPLYPGEHVLSVTNPIWMDVDGNGFTAPGL